MADASHTGRPRRSKNGSRRPAAGGAASRGRAAPQAKARPKTQPAPKTKAAARPPVEQRPPHHSARLSVPARPPDQLVRRRLVDNIHENIHRKVFLISAAAGYGKSSLLAAFAAETIHRLAWLQLDETDRDLVVLITDLTNALAEPFPGFVSQVPRLAAEPGAAPKNLAAALVGEIERELDEYFVLALDDFHRLEGAPAIIEFFNGLVEYLPDQAHLLLAGRALPELQFPRLAARQQIAGLSEEDLRFRPDEVQELLRLRNRVDMPPSAAEALVANTEGWITGILLTTHLMWQGLMAHLVAARETESPLFDYLAIEVLDQQPEPLRQFLLESSVLPEMEPQTCDQVLGRADSARLLRLAENQRLFVSAVGNEFRTYQYHNLFRDFLQQQLRRQSPARLKQLQARAAEWYAANDMPEAALTYFVEAGELDRAAEVAESHARSMYTSGRRATLSRWVEQLAPVARQAPRLHVLLATIEIDSGNLPRAAGLLRLAGEAYTEHGNEGGLVEVDLRRAWGLIRQNQFQPALELASAAAARARRLGLPASEATGLRYMGRCLTDLGRAAEAEQPLKAAADLLGQEGQTDGLALTLHDLANSYRMRGLTMQASEAQRQALALMRSAQLVGPLSALLNDIAWDLHMLGQYEGALATYAEGMDWARRSGNALSQLTIAIGQADVLADLGETAQASALYRQALGKAETSGEWTMVVYLQCALARQDRRAGNYAGALEWLRRAERAANGRRVSVPMANIAALRGVVLTETGQLEKGKKLLAGTLAALEQTEVPVDLAQCLFFYACAEFRSGETAAAAALVGRALSVAEAVGYDQMLLTEAEQAADMLAACRGWPELEPRVGGLLARARGLSQMRARLAERGALPSGPAAAPAPRHGLEARLLGMGQVCRDGREIAKGDWHSQRPRELFFWLIDCAPVSRDRALAVFWPDMEQTRAVANMHQTLYRLRRAVGEEVVVLDASGFRLAPGLILRSDVAQFEAVARAALGFNHSDLRRLGALEAAVALYTGDYLTDISTEWAAARRHSLLQTFVRLLSEYADELMTLARFAEARANLERALALEPLRDDLHGRMLVCLAALSRRHEVVDHYRRYRDTLRTELGLDPPPDIRSLYSRLIA